MASTSTSRPSPVLPGRGGQWLELTITLPAAGAEELGHSLVALGSPGVVEEAVPCRGRTEDGLPMAKLMAAFPLEQVSDRLLGDVRRCLDELGPEIASQAAMAMRVTAGDAWVHAWQRFYHPFRVGRRLIIRPPWESYAAAGGDLVLTLNPGQAFGTGLHATTQLCLELLDEMATAQPSATLLDLGCGSGILSLAAVLFGFEHAHGVDLDAVAVEVAQQNARLNDLAARASFAVGSLEAITCRFEIVVANILLEPIIAMLQALHAAVTPGGSVVLSGILCTEVAQLQRGLVTHGWRMTRWVWRDEWAAVVCGEA